MNTFKLSQKPVHTDCRSSIENIHDEYIDKLQVKYNNCQLKELELKNVKNELQKAYNEKNFSQIIPLKDRIKLLEEEIKDINNQTELADYLCKAIPFIKDIDETDNKDSKIYKETTVENCGILKYVTSNGTTDKGTKYSDYLETCFNIPSGKPVNITKHANYCKECKSTDRTIDTKEAVIVCSDCGACEKYNDNSNQIDWSRVDSTEFIQVFTYKRKNHFKEWLTQLQAKESTIIPESILELLYLELKKERISDPSDITYTRIRQYLKKLRLNKYYEHIPNIINRITNKKGLVITTELENKLMNMFDLIQEPFEKYCPKTRKNFLSYSFTLHKFCQLLNRNDLLIYFPLLKSREKLFEQDKIWKNICAELEWKYISTI